MNNVTSLTNDFWWLPENVTFDDLVVGVGHHKEIADNEDVAPLESWYRSLTPKGNLSNEVQYYAINSLDKWRNACNNTNVYRTIKVFDRNTGEVIFLGPFLIDIDNSRPNNNYREDLINAQTVTKQVVACLVGNLGLSSNDLRIFFSGRKGFNVEVRPEILGISGSVDHQIKCSGEKLNEIIAALRNENNIQDSSEAIVGRQGRVIHSAINIVSNGGTVIDSVYGNRFQYRLKHPYIRLHNSINKWITGDGEAVARRKIEITSKELQGKSATEICSYSEKQARLP